MILGDVCLLSAVGTAAVVKVSSIVTVGEFHVLWILI